jgi:hypothetical protein
VGVGEIKTTAREAQVKSQFFMDTQDGRDTFTAVKRLHEAGLGDWSYGYDAMKWSMGEYGDPPQRVRFLEKLKVHEVSPVLVGAGVNTRTLDAKASQGGGGTGNGGTVATGIAFAPHETDVSDGMWDAQAITNALGLTTGVEDLRGMHAWVDTTADPGHKAAYRFMHHHGPGGPASVRACLIGIAVLNGAKGESVPDEVKAGVYAHLAAHLGDAERVAPELRGPDGQLKLNDQLMIALADVSRLVAEVSEVGASRALKGKHAMTKSTMDILGWMDEDMAALRALLTTPDESVAREYARFVATLHGRPTS